MAELESVQLARLWIECWNENKPLELPLATDFVHTSPFGILKGREHYLDTVIPLAAKNVNELKIVHVMGEPGQAVVWFEMVNDNEVTRTVDWLKTADGLIQSVDSFYDASNIPHFEQY